MFEVGWTQHPVGHGGFHTGLAKASGGASFRWIFDCGARTSSKLDNYLGTWTHHHGQPVDWLFISHFDTDHVSGLDTLMLNADIRNVMVPYVNERELAYLLLDEIGRGRLSWSLVELLADPAQYFLSRGAARVTFLGGPGETDAGFEEGPRGPDVDGDTWQIKISPFPQLVRISNQQVEGGVRASDVQTIAAASCAIDVFQGNWGIRLKPYRAPIERHAHCGLLKAIAAKVAGAAVSKPAVGLGRLAYAIAQHARTATGRADLRGVFKSHAGSSNRSSLSLLSHPWSHRAKPECRWYVNSHFHFEAGLGLPAWLNTGDAELLDTDDLVDWATAYAAELGEVRVASLPHHGSDKNSDAAFQLACPKALFTAQVRDGSKKHPGAYVAAIAGSKLHPVTSEPISKIEMSFIAR